MIHLAIKKLRIIIGFFLLSIVAQENTSLTTMLTSVNYNTCTTTANQSFQSSLITTEPTRSKLVCVKNYVTPKCMCIACCGATAISTNVLAGVYYGWAAVGISMFAQCMCVTPAIGHTYCSLSKNNSQEDVDNFSQKIAVHCSLSKKVTDASSIQK